MRARQIGGLLWELLGLGLLAGVLVSGCQDSNPRGGRSTAKRPRVTQVDREVVAARSQALSLPAMSAAHMADPMSVPHYFGPYANYANSPLPGNAVADWNAIAQDILQPPPMPGMPAMGSSMSAAFVQLAYLHAAVYNALVAIEGGFAPYHSTLAPAPAAAPDAAVAAAAYGVLNHYKPSAPLTATYTGYLAAIADAPGKAAGIALGEQATAEIVALRAADQLSGTGGYVLPAAGPGIWEPTATMPDGSPMPPMDPWMAKLTPFLRSAAEQYRPATKPELTDASYLADLAEVRAVGSTTSATRTAEQTEIARFWTTNMVTQTNAAYRQLAESRGLGLLATARLMALGNMIASDSLIATFDAKYHYSFWRPVTAIRNDATTPDPAWTPVVATPNFPEYVAGHGSFVSAQAELFTHFFGAQIDVDLTSDVTGTVRHYANADALRTEVVNARTWGGMHFRGSTTLAVTMGQQLVTDALALHFLPAPAGDTGRHAMISGGIRKFVDTLPGLTAAGANNLGQYIPIAAPDTTTYPGSDYYEIAVVQFQMKMHSDLPATKLRGYVQLGTSVVPGTQALSYPDGTPITINGQQVLAVDQPRYLGPLISATKDRPVRILFRNLLPTGQGGDLFLPVDTTVMGSGMGPEMGGMSETDPQRPMCGMTPKPMGCFTENRATLHLHGGISPWISDGTPHQWVTPAGEDTMYPKGVSVSQVPDMPDPGPGAITFFYTNQQSARLMFYHDHAWGITRLNVYAGEAAAYLITDPTEQSLITQGLIPATQIPLVIQDKTFVPTASQLAWQDPTWDVARWGGLGNLWVPHVYMPAQNPGDSSGVNQFGRWAYGPWFWPPTLNILYPPIANPYYDPACNPDLTWCEPPLIPGVPYLSMGMESFHDTPLVNGTAYPSVTLEPKAHRFRVLNAANDRFWNLQMYLADTTGTEVAMVPAIATPGFPPLWPTDGREEGVPDPTKQGPNWLQIGTEGGFLPAPVVVPNQPITWVTDPTVFNAGNVQDHSLLLGPAERADVIVDFSQFAGQTLILFNDAPAAFPARDPRYDYYTGGPDLRDTGGAPTTLPGYGPNTRTIMQIKIAGGAPAPAYDPVPLQTAFKATSLGGQGVFQSSQNPIIVGQGAYNSAYGTAFMNNGPRAGLAQIFSTSLSFDTVSGTPLTIPFKQKAIQDEMGEAYEQEYGRMSGNLGVEVPQVQAGLQQNLVLYPYVNPATEVLDGVVDASPISTADDGTQIWKITHNGVDTHPIHFHLFDVQLINRVGWDGIIRRPHPTELGWKDTLRVSPLEDTIVALRPILPKQPFGLPDSVRPLNPMMPIGSTAMFTSVDTNGNPITPPISNQVVNFGWEYVWHCHILSHEEMDMMRPMSVNAARALPATPSVGVIRVVAGAQLIWSDGTPVDYQNISTWANPAGEVGYRIERAELGAGGTPGTYVPIASALANQTTFTDATANGTLGYSYRVIAYNAAGNAVSAPASLPAPGTVPGAPVNVTAVAGIGQATISFDPPLSDGGQPIVSYEVTSSPGSLRASAIASPIVVTGLINGTAYTFTVTATNAIGTGPASAPSNSVTPIDVPPAAPNQVRATASPLSASPPTITVSWSDNSNNETGFRLTRSTNRFFTGTLAIFEVTAGVTTFVDTTVTPRTRYWYSVSAWNSAGETPRSNASTANAIAAGQLPATPALTVSGTTRNSISLAWTVTTPPAISTFQLQRSNNGVNRWTNIVTLPGSTTGYTNTLQPPATTRSYRVRASNAYGWSAWSNVAAGTTLP